MPKFCQYLTREQEDELAAVAKLLVAPGKGILAADESASTFITRFEEINLENTAENRQKYREILFSCDDVINEHISGVILHDEAARQSDSSGTPFVKCLERKGIIPGVKVDKGVVHLPGTNHEFTTAGLDGLKERCDEYKSMGLHFTKWRCVLIISHHTPSCLAMADNSNLLARFASISQQCGLVPILQADVLSDGDHDLECARQVTEELLSVLYKTLADHHIYLEGTILKTSMVTPGIDYKETQPTPEEVALATVRALYRRIPPAVAGITFLSGGQTDDVATANLNAINRVQLRIPWPLTFCFGRAIQNSVLKAWQGNDENKETAQKEFLKRAKENGLASVGKFIVATEDVIG